MVEVFKTDVTDLDYSLALVEILKQNFPGYEVNFDLHDCDNILRIKSCTENINTLSVINLLQQYGFHATILPDEIPQSKRANRHPFIRTTVFG